MFMKTYENQEIWFSPTWPDRWDNGGRTRDDQKISLKKNKKRMLVDALVCISTPQDTVDSVGG